MLQRFVVCLLRHRRRHADRLVHLWTITNRERRAGVFGESERRGYGNSKACMDRCFRGPRYSRITSCGGPTDAATCRKQLLHTGGVSQGNWAPLPGREPGSSSRVELFCGGLCWQPRRRCCASCRNEFSPYCPAAGPPANPSASRPAHLEAHRSHRARFCIPHPTGLWTGAFQHNATGDAEG